MKKRFLRYIRKYGPKNGHQRRFQDDCEASYKDNCASCSHWEYLCMSDDGFIAEGSCKLKPPLLEGVGASNCVQPTMESHWGCSEHTRTSGMLSWVWRFDWPASMKYKK